MHARDVHAAARRADVRRLRNGGDMKAGEIDAEFEQDPKFDWMTDIDTMRNRRQPGLVDDAFAYLEHDHDVWQVNVGIDFGGGHQAFCPFFGRGQTSRFRAFVMDVCKTFGVAKIEHLVGRRCYALRAFPGWGETIEGLEDFDSGRRITLTGWWRANAEPCPDPLERAVERLRNDVESAMRKVAAYEEELKELKAGYADWTKP
jgi:hypothetical protein